MDFFRNYNRLVGITYVAILLAIGVFLYFDIREKRAHELTVIRSRTAQHAVLMETALSSSADYVDAMRINAWSFYAAQPKNDPRQSLLFKQLRWDESANYFHLDEVVMVDNTGNLTGDGPLTGRSATFYRDIEMALDLAAIFQAIGLNVPSAVQAYFISKEGFQNVFPWVPSYRSRFAPAVFQKKVFVLGTPARNRAREKFWTPAFIADDDRGLMVSAGAPVYEEDDFRGVVGLDLSLEYLNRINADFGYDLGQVFIYNNFDQLIAHPHLISPAADKEVKPLAAALPADWQSTGTAMLGDLDDGLTEIDGRIVIKYTFRGAPWALIYLLDSHDLLLRLLAERGPPILVVVAALTLLLLVANWLTRREFIMPASLLVKHIDRESRFEPTTTPPVPAPWMPWFRKISDAFRVNAELLSIRQELDVARRMQLSILPQGFPDRSDLAIYGRMRSAKEVGGDFYDFFTLDDARIGIVVADVSGKGVPAALFGMVSRTLIRATATAGNEPGKCIALANDLLCEDNEQVTFVTVFYGILDTRSGVFTYVNGGHPPPFRIGRDGSIGSLPLTGGMALGVMQGIDYEECQAQLAPGDSLVLYTDGITEAFDPHGNEFTVARLGETLTRMVGLSARELVEDLIDDVDSFARGVPQADDITCVAVTWRQSRPAEPGQSGLATATMP